MQNQEQKHSEMVGDCLLMLVVMTKKEMEIEEGNTHALKIFDGAAWLVCCGPSMLMQLPHKEIRDRQMMPASTPVHGPCTRGTNVHPCVSSHWSCLLREVCAAAQDQDGIWHS